jgi:hypothetical protein
MLKVGDQVEIRGLRGKLFRCKIIRISEHSLKPLYKVVLINNYPYDLSWRYEEELLHVLEVF